jgi:2-(1,2-epoxy-1,2-dihydrophenyl)acetyl-CoA isomerase
MTDNTEIVQVEQRGGVAIIWLSRPEKYNAVNTAMHKGLAAAVKTIRRNSEIRAVVLTGRGKAFCSGQDLGEFKQQPDDFRVDDHVRNTFNQFVLSLRDLPLPVIAAVNGVAAGAGASLALAADMRVMGRTSSLIQAFVRVGLVPDTGSTWFLPHLVGPARALELAWTGRPVGADEALTLGLANAVVDDHSVVEEAVALADQLANMPTRAIAMTKRAVYRSLNVSLEDALEHEAQLQQAAADTHDHHEGVTAFLEKREPVFTGR